MLASIEARGCDENGQVKVTLKNGKLIRADVIDVIVVVENTTGLSPNVAEHAAGVAWAMAMEEGAESVPWKRLQQMAERSYKEFQEERLRMN